MKLLLLFSTLLVTINAGTYGVQKTTLEDIERDYTKGDKSLSYIQSTKGDTGPVSSPTKFGFVPHRIAASYAATKPKYQYGQGNYLIKKAAQKSPNHYPQQVALQYSSSKPQVSYQQQYSSASSQQYVESEKPSAQQYSSSAQQYIPQQQPVEYTYVQPESTNAQYIVQHQQPTQQYEKYENVQYVADNSITQQDGKQYYDEQPQYYYVQQDPAPSTAVESVLDPKGIQYVMYFPTYAANSIPIDPKYQQKYYVNEEPQLPPVTTTVAKYTTVVPSGKSSSTKQYNEVPYVVSSPKQQPEQEEQVAFQREPKSLLDSYVPSILQVQYLKQQQSKSRYSKH